VEVIEVFADRDSDPAELWLIRENPADDEVTALELRYGTETVLRLNVGNWQLVDPSELKPLDEKEA